MGLHHFKRFTRLIVLMLVLSLCLTQVVFAAEVKLFTDGLTITDTQNTLSKVNDTSVKATVKSDYTTRKTNTVTLKNTSGSKMELSFQYSVPGNLDTGDAVNFKIDDKDYSNGNSKSVSGSYTKILDNNGSVTVAFIDSRWNSNTSTLTLSNITFKAVQEESQVTVNYNDSLGSVTVGGDAVANGGVAGVPASGATAVATAKSGAVFLGWIDANNKIISTSASFKLETASDTSVSAVFTSASSNAVFRVAKDYMFYNLTDACNFAKNYNLSKTVVLAYDGILPASSKDYEIPSGVTLLIPFDDNDTLITTDFEDSAIESTATPTTYRTLKNRMGIPMGHGPSGLAY